MTCTADDFNPRISIITVTYNAARELEQTIASIISQSYDNIELLIIDGNSSDNTFEILQPYRHAVDYLVSEPDAGIYDAMNKGLAAARGDYVLFLNAGDYFYTNDSLKNIVNAAGGPFDVIYGDIQLVATNGSARHHKALEFSLDNLKKFGTGVLCHQAILVSMKIAPRYDTGYTYKGELNWYFDMYQTKPDLSWYHHKEPFVYYFLGGKGYQHFLRNRLEWYGLLIRRFGVGSVLNRNFVRFIIRDFRFRYGLYRSKN